MPARTRPIDKLAAAAAKCSKEVLTQFQYIFSEIAIDTNQSSAYGKCIFADYNNVHKDMCATEFMKLKECYLVR